MTTIQAYVSGSISLPGSCPPRVIEELRDALTFPNPEFIRRTRFAPTARGVPKTIELMGFDDGCVRVPRGAVGDVKRFASKAGVGIRFVDRRIVKPPASFASSIDLRDYQQEAVRRMVNGVQGTVCLPCGGGKTVVGLAAAAMIDQPTLILVHTHDLLEQWRDRAADMLGVEAASFSGRRRDVGPFTVATVQSLVRLPRAEKVEWAQAFGCVIVDEAHHTPATTFRDVVSGVAAKYRFGLTATPDREDGLTDMMTYCLGPELYSIGQPELMRRGYLTQPKVVELRSTFSFVVDDARSSADREACMRSLIRDKERNRLIVDTVARDAKAGRTVLVLSGRVEHCRTLASLISNEGVEAAILVGDVGHKDRARILDRLRAGDLRVSVASTVADEGLDVPRLERVVLAYPTQAKARITQRLGRLMRIAPGKSEPVLYDVVDTWVPWLARQAAVRRRLYRKTLGKNAVSVSA